MEYSNELSISPIFRGIGNLVSYSLVSFSTMLAFGLVHNVIEGYNKCETTTLSSAVPIFPLCHLAKEEAT